MLFALLLGCVLPLRGTQKCFQGRDLALNFIFLLLNP